MSKFIFTGCNAGRDLSKFSLVYLDLNEMKFQSIIIPKQYLADTEFIGFTGIEQIKEKYYVAVQSFPVSKILVFDIGFSVIDQIVFEKNYDLHTIFGLDEKLYITLTSSNKVICFDTISKTFSDEWSFDGENLHLNSFKKINGKRLALMHTSFINESKNGALIDLDSKTELIGGLKKPHDIFHTKKFLFVSSSAKGQCFRVNLENGRKNLYKQFNGYLRGIFIDDDLELFAISSQRLYSRKKGIGVNQLKNFEEYYSDEKFESFLYFYNKKNNIELRINFTDVIDEVYEIFRVRKTPINLYQQTTQVLRTKAYKKRLNKIELELNNQKNLAKR